MNFDKNWVLPHRDSSGLRSLPVNERDFKTKQKQCSPTELCRKKWSTTMLKPSPFKIKHKALKKCSPTKKQRKYERNIKALPRPDSPSLPLRSPLHMVGVQSLLRWSCSWGTQRTPSRSEPLQIHKYWFLFAIINAFVTYKKSLEGAKTSESYRHLIGLVILVTSWKKRQDYFRTKCGM